jgi:magnesium-transporting ATPase (P-type)
MFVIILAVLQEKLTKLALYIGYIGLTAAVLTLICLIIRFCITKYVVQKKKGQAGDVSYFISFLIQAITVIVVSVPEGLIHLFSHSKQKYISHT